MPIAGTLSEYVHGLYNREKATRKFTSPNFGLNKDWQPVKEKETDPQKAMWDQYLEDRAKAADSMRLDAINGKLDAGRELSSDDMSYLRDKAPQLYEKAKRVHMARENYKRELRMCRTKKDVERLKQSRATTFVADLQVAAAKNDVERTKEIGQTFAAGNDELHAFKHTRRYKEMDEE